MQFDRGYLSPHFVTNEDDQECAFENCRILIHEEKISSTLKDLVPLFWKQVSKDGAPLLIIAEDIEGEALATLVVNKMRGIVKVAAVKAPGYGDRRKAMLEDLAVLTGGKAFFKDLGIKLDNVQLSDLGRGQDLCESMPTKQSSLKVPARRATSTVERIRFAAKSKEPTANTIVRNCRNAWPSWPAVSLRSKSVLQPKPK